MPDEVGQFFHTEGENTGRVKIDSDKAEVNAREMANAEEAIRRAQMEANKTGKRVIVEVPHHTSALEPGGDRLVNEIEWSQDRIAKANIGFEAGKDDLMRAQQELKRNPNSSFAEGDLKAAAKKAEKTDADYEKLMRAADKEKIKRLQKQIKDMK